MKRIINKVRKEMHQLGLTAFLVSDIVHIRYLTGLKLTEKGDAYLLIAKDNYYLITDERYQEQAQNLVKNGKVIIGAPDEKIEIAAGFIKEEVGTAGFEKENLTVSEFQNLKNDLVELILPRVRYEKPLLGITNLIENESSIKDQWEIRKIRKAAGITDHIFQEHLLDLIKPGIKETDLSAEISYLGKKHGAENDAFEPIVLFGKNSSLPHGQPSNKKLKKNDIIQLDFGYFYQGYCSDLSRVLILGKPTAKQKKIHKIVLEAQEKAIEAVKPGIEAKKLDKIARDFIKQNGHEFVHGLGHGIGIKIHTSPHITKNVNDIVRPNQIFTIEPGIYIPGWGGMRIEDDVLVTKDGYEVLTKSSRELIAI